MERAESQDSEAYAVSRVIRELARTRAFFEILSGRFWSDSGLEQKATKVTKEKILHFGTGQI